MAAAAARAAGVTGALHAAPRGAGACGARHQTFSNQQPIDSAANNELVELPDMASRQNKHHVVYMGVVKAKTTTYWRGTLAGHEK